MDSRAANIILVVYICKYNFTILHFNYIFNYKFSTVFKSSLNSQKYIIFSIEVIVVLFSKPGSN